MTDPASKAHPVGRTLDPNLTLGEVSLTVRDLDLQVQFYTVALGLTLLAREGARAVLGTSDGHPLVTLHHDPQAPKAPANATGLYHLAIAFPTRPDLARWLQHAAALGLRLGQNDHKTHEAFYLADPEGNGVEIYHDWPRERWPFKDGVYTSADGGPIDIQGLIGALGASDPGWTNAPNGTRMGHVHLKMSDTNATRAFYEQVMGFNITLADPRMVFAAVAGYHHHIGNNAWHSHHGPTPPSGALGLRHYTIELSNMKELDAVTARLEHAGAVVHGTPAGTFTSDPSGNRVLLRAAPSTIKSALTALHDLTPA